MIHSYLRLSHVVCSKGGGCEGGYIRCDWETILVRLRPRESTWLDTLLAVDRTCLVRTRPACVQGEKLLEIHKKNTLYLPMLTRLSQTVCSPESKKLPKTMKKQLMLEAESSDPKVNTHIEPGARTKKYTRDASVD